VRPGSGLAIATEAAMMYLNRCVEQAPRRTRCSAIRAPRRSPSIAARTESPANTVSQGWHTEYLLPKSPQEHT